MGYQKCSCERVDVVFIIISYNTKNLLEDILNFFEDAKLPFTYSIIVVDNKSTDGSIELLSNKKNIYIILNEKNLGYGKAVNKGVCSSDSKYICVLNADLILNVKALTAVWEYMESNSNVGICSPVICYPGGKIQGFVFKFSIVFFYINFINRMYSKFIKLLISKSKYPLKVDGVTGAFIFLRRSMMNNDKLFDEDFFFYYEDTDLAHRWNKRNIECVVLPQHSIIHIGGQSGIRNNTQFNRSKYLYISKHYSVNHAKNIFYLDCFNIRKKVIQYKLLSFLFPTQRIKTKLLSYDESFKNLSKILPF